MATSKNAKLLQKQFNTAENFYQKAIFLSKGIVIRFEAKFGEDCPVLDMMLQLGDGMVIVYKNKLYDYNNSLVDGEKNIIAKLYDCNNNEELLEMLESLGG